ncbi:unnamed protein product [Prorocentrum cordatum]|uniref:Non-specific serine/threonine protein kinase n=1 Tax=Prorocentrum cordatum TaxID=2364126 RepID=A0ABN9WAK6_9DINO|nr:unnamed protein product [Polarella glacialis]
MLPGRAPGPFLLRQVYEQPHVMVIDLGVAKIFQPGNFRHNRPIGTPATMAPEVWSGDITPKADVFSCGVVLFELLALSLPFNCTAQHEEAINYWFSMPLAPWSRTRHASNAAVELCRRMLRLDRHMRPTASQCLRAPFFEARGISDDADGSVAALLKGLVHVPERSVLHNSVALSIAQAWPSNQLPTIKAAFRELDAGASGQLTKDQVALALERLGVDREPARASADALDLSRSGAVGWTEFVAGCIRLGSDRFEEDLLRIFKEADSDNDGLLTQKDVASLLAADHLHGDAACDVFADLVGRVDPGARVDWPTFRRHFRCPLDDAEDSLAAPVMAAPIMVPACHQAGAEIMGHAMDLWERAMDLGHAFWPLQEDPGEPEEEKLRRLAEMGFTDRDRHRNKLCSRAVEELMRGGAAGGASDAGSAGGSGAPREAAGRSPARRPSTAPRRRPLRLA